MRDRLHRFLRPGAHDSGIVDAAPPVAAAAIVRRFWPFTRPYRRWIALGLLLLVVVPAIETLEIYLFKHVVDDVLVPQDLGALVPLAAIYLGLALLTAALSFGDEYLATWIGERFLLDLRARLYAHIHTLSPAQLGRRPVGDVLARLTGDVQAIERFLLSALGTGVSALARIAFFATALVLLSWKLALVAFVVAPLFFVTARRFGSLVRHASREKRRRSGSLSTVAEQALGSVPLIQSLGREGDEVDRFRRENAAIMDAELAATRVRGTYAPIVDLIELVGAMAVVGAGVWALRSGDLTLGGMLVFITYLSQLYRPIRDLGNLSNDLFSAAAGAERVIDLLAEEPEIRDAPHARPLPSPVRGHVSLDGVTVRHPASERDALCGVTLTVRPGEVVALVGDSGAGKSTLAQALLRFVDPVAGVVRIDGHDVRDATLRSLRENVGLLLQETHLPDGSAREAIAQGKPGATDAEVTDAARASGALEVLERRPDGLDTPIGPGGGLLSGGERRRIAIARALLRDTPVVVLDEPTTGLDAAGRDRLHGPLRALVEGRTTIIISHDPVVVGWADRVIELDAGRLASDRRTGLVVAAAGAEAVA